MQRLQSVCVVVMVCVLLSLLGEVDKVGGVKGCGEIRGQRPHGRKRPPHAVWG